MRQHADDPVDRRERGEDVVVGARERDVPIVHSMGCSSCHWCHVIAHGSAAQGLGAPFCVLSDTSRRVLEGWSVHRVCVGSC